MTNGMWHIMQSRIMLDRIVKGIPPAVELRSVVDAIGAGAHRIAEIAGERGVPQRRCLARSTGSWDWISIARANA